MFTSFSSSLLLCVDCVSALRSLRFLEVVQKNRHREHHILLLLLLGIRLLLFLITLLFPNGNVTPLVSFFLVLWFCFCVALSKVVTCDDLLFSRKWAYWKKNPLPSFSSSSSVFSHRITIPNGNVVLVFFFFFLHSVVIVFSAGFQAWESEVLLLCHSDMQGHMSNLRITERWSFWSGGGGGEPRDFTLQLNANEDFTVRADACVCSTLPLSSVHFCSRMHLKVLSKELRVEHICAHAFPFDSLLTECLFYVTLWGLSLSYICGGRLCSLQSQNSHNYNLYLGRKSQKAPSLMLSLKWNVLDSSLDN